MADSPDKTQRKPRRHGKFCKIVEVGKVESPIRFCQEPVRDRLRSGGNRIMLRTATLIGLSCWLSLLAGCRCFPAVEKYHDTIDCVSDFDILWDRWYNPPWDVSRAGRPDWCSSSFNRWVCPCRCQQGVWHGYCGLQHYPPNHPYSYPSQVIPLQGTVLAPNRRGALIEEMHTPAVTPLEGLPKSEPTLEAPPKPNSPESGSATRIRERSWLPTSAHRNQSETGWMETE